MPRKQQQDDGGDSDLATLLALAKISSEFQDPDIKRQQLQQEDQQSRLRAALSILGLQQSGKEAAATLGETSRYHTAEIGQAEKALGATETGRKETARSNILQEVLQTFGQRPDFTPGMASEMLKQGGYPEMADAFTQQHQKDINKQVLGHAAAIGALKSDPNKLKTYLGTITDPDVMAQLKPHLDALTSQPQAAVPTAPPISQSRELARREVTPPLSELLKHLPISWNVPSY